MLQVGLFLVITTVALSVGQAWAIAEIPRWPRYLFVWALTSTTMVLVSVWGIAHGAGWMAPTVGILGPLLVASALGVGDLRATDRKLAALHWTERVQGLVGVHFATLILGGALVWVITILVAFSRIH
jgi:hypothetical protein